MDKKTDFWKMLELWHHGFTQRAFNRLHVVLYHTTQEDDIYNDLLQQVDGQRHSVLHLGPQGMVIAAATRTKTILQDAAPICH